MIKAVDNHAIIYLEEEVDKSNVVLMCHGITSSKEEGGFYDSFSARLNSFGFSTFRFDFRGHGDSAIPSFNATVAGMIADLNSVINYLNGKYRRISIIAASFGASILLLLMQQRKLSVSSVVLLNPITDYNTVFTATSTAWAKSFFPMGDLNALLTHNKEIIIGNDFILSPLMALEFYYYKPNLVAWNYDIPAVVLHGTKDLIVPIKDSRDFVKRSNGNFIQLIEFSGATHGLEENTEEVISRSCEFLDRWFK